MGTHSAELHGALTNSCLWVPFLVSLVLHTFSRDCFSLPTAHLLLEVLLEQCWMTQASLPHHHCLGSVAWTLQLGSLLVGRWRKVSCKEGQFEKANWEGKSSQAKEMRGKKP